jgi:hypothetical protein
VQGLFVLIAIASPIFVLDLLAAMFGVDSRDGFKDFRDRPDLW